MFEPRVDARIFFKNVPPTFGKKRMRELAKQFGKVSKVDFMPSTLNNGRTAGFIHMRSKSAAESVIKTINQTVHDGATLYAHMEHCEPIYEPVLTGSMFTESMMWSGSHMPYMTSGFINQHFVGGSEDGQDKGNGVEKECEEMVEEEGEEDEEEGEEDEEEEMAALRAQLIAIRGPSLTDKPLMKTIGTQMKVFQV